MSCGSGYLSLLLLIFLASLPEGQTVVCCRAWSRFAECCDDLCVAQRSIDTLSKQPRTLYYCLNKNSNPHWRESCNGLEDTNVTVVQCCTEENCNNQLFPRLPSEPTVPTTYPPYRPTITPSTTSEPTTTEATVSTTSEPTTTEATVSTTNSSTTNSSSATTSSTSAPTTGSVATTATTEATVSTTNSSTTNSSSATTSSTSAPTTGSVATTATTTTDKLIKCVKRYQGVPLNGHPGFCYGKSCYAERNRVGHPLVWGCVDERFVDCSVDSEAQVILCCSRFDRCNRLLDPMLPSERNNNGSTTPISPTSGTERSTERSTDQISDNPFDWTYILLIVFIIIALVLIVGIATFFTCLLWRKYNETKIVSDFKNPCPESPNEVLSLAGSSEANLDSTEIKAIEIKAVLIV